MSSAYLLVSTPTWMKRLLSRSVHSNSFQDETNSSSIPVGNRFAFAIRFDIINVNLTFICTLSIGTLFTLKMKNTAAEVLA